MTQVENTEENLFEKSIIETPRQTFVRLLEYLRTSACDGNIEDIYPYALKRLREAKLSNVKRLLFEQELKDLLMAGFEAEARNNLEEAMLVSKTTDVQGNIEGMRIFLIKAGIDEEVWLKKQGSSIGEIDVMLEEGYKNREVYLEMARTKVKQG